MIVSGHVSDGLAAAAAAGGQLTNRAKLTSLQAAESYN